MTASVAVDAEAITKRFGSLVAVDGLTLQVDGGEVFGFLGPNGAGKTTTIRMLMDALRPTQGRLNVLGRSPRDASVRRRVGYLPSELHLDPRYTTDEAVAFYGGLRGGVARADVDVLCERFDLDPRRRIGQLSTGNRRKVGIVLAFMHRPELLVLDEPTTGLDPLLQHQFHDLVLERVAAGATAFLSSHVLPEVEALADRVAIIRRGRLATVATVEELRRQARHRIELHIAGPFDAAAFEAVPEVVSVDVVHGDTVHVVVEGSVANVVRVAARFEVARLVTHEADLDELFRSFYRDGDDGDDGAP